MFFRKGFSLILVSILIVQVFVLIFNFVPSVHATTGDTEDFVDSNSSDVDTHAGHGTSSNFTAQQDANVLFNDTLTEANTSNGTGVLGSSTASTTGSTTIESQIVGSLFTPSSSGWLSNIMAYIGVTTAIKNGGASLYRHSDLVWIANTSMMSLALGTSWRTFTFAQPYPAVVVGTDYILVAWCATGSGNGLLYYGTGVANQGHIDPQTWGAWPNPLVPTTHNAFVYDINASMILPSYEFDYEFSWATASFSESNEYLCIRTSTLDAEALAVNVWTDNAYWTNINSGLVANSWNNISIGGYLLGTQITFRFLGGTEVGDTVQSTWIIECNLIHVWSVESGKSSSSTESDYVNGFTATTQQWTTHTGASPWLDNNVSNSIKTFTTLQMDANYTFADTAIPYFANITLIQLTVDTKTSTELVSAQCYLSTGGAWSSAYTFGFDGTSSWITESATVTSLFSTLTNINNCVMKINSSRTGASASITVRYVHLTITYTVTTATTSTFYGSIPFILSFTKRNSFAWAIQGTIQLAVNGFNINGLMTYIEQNFLNAFGNIPFAFLTEIQRSISFSRQGVVPLSFNVASIYTRLASILNFFGELLFQFTMNSQRAMAFTRESGTSLTFSFDKQRTVAWILGSSVPLSFIATSTYARLASILNFFGNIPFNIATGLQNALSFTRQGVASLNFLTGTQRALTLNRENSIPLAFNMLSKYGQARSLAFLGNIVFQFAEAFQKAVSITYSSTIPLSFTISTLYSQAVQGFLYFFGYIPISFASNLERIISFNVQGAVPLTFIMNRAYSRLATLLNLFGTIIFNFAINMAKTFGFNIFSTETLAFTVNSITNIIGAPVSLFIFGLVNFIFNIGNVGYATIPLSGLAEMGLLEALFYVGFVFGLIALSVVLVMKTKRRREE